VFVVVAYLGMLLAALSLGGQPAPQPVLTPRSTLVVTLLDRPEPVELPVDVKSGTTDSASIAVTTPTPSDARNALPRAVKSKPKANNTQIQEPSPVTSAAQPTTATATKPPLTAASEAPASGGLVSTAPATTATRAAGPAAAAVRGIATGAAAGSGTGSPRAGNDLTVLPFTDGMTRPKLLDMVEPQYTREARDASVKGLFLAKCVITTSGTLQKCRVVKGLPMMDQAVLSALARWRYTPVIYQGKPVAVEYVIQVRLTGP
jgi:TonB family protein